MQPASFPIADETLSRIWEDFVSTGRVDWPEIAIIDPAVLASWQRCAFRLDPLATPRPNRAGEGALATVLRARAALNEIAVPFMEDIHQFIEGAGCAILLADGTGCVHTLVGDDDAVNLLEEAGLGRGAYWAEGQTGTTALALALYEAMPSLVIGPEHFFRACHHLATTAAPVHDVRGRIAGVLSIVGPARMGSPQSLALAMSAARAISNQLHTNWFLEEANRHLSEVNTILGAITDGVIAWNESGKILHMNEQAGQIVSLNPSSVVGRPLPEMLALPANLLRAIEEEREIRDDETTFLVDDQSITCLASLRPIGARPAGAGRHGERPARAGMNQPVGHILLLRPIEQVRRLVHQQIGSKAAVTLDDLPSQTPRMREVLRQARIAARGSAPVLISGEGGVGKNHLARAIHDDRGRTNRPFVVIDCRAIPHELMASEFLGQARGTGILGQPSKFELAHGGTLLLDQVESLSLELQTALLRVLETGHVMRLGGSQPIQLDVRIMAITTADLNQLVADGSFISHLYYRFGVFNIQIPPVRERVDDIPLIAERFLARIGQRGDRALWIDDAAMATLCRYPWPGNVREMESALERAVALSQDGVVRVVNLPDVVRSGRVITAASPQAEPVLSVADAEREAIIRAGWANHGRVTDMAQQLGIGRTTLWRKMKRLNISPADFKH
ncbi:MAG: PTS-dependent dihydroxyacetone kinase operon transcriptional regulator DhaR [Chloroflexota bacterium]|nr:MAG: PTS-dependent dihydroxyacetone kinase operon transcriptional regulator DhaR [Chloroflexota bacterium]